MNRRLSVMSLAFIAVLATGCTSTTPGTGTGAPATGTPVPSTSDSADPSTLTNSGLASIQPCDLLSSADLTQNDISSGQPSNEGGGRNCNWKNRTADNELGYSLEIDLRDAQGLEDISTDGQAISTDAVGQHQGKLVQDPGDETCFVAIGVSPTSRVDILVATGSSVMSESCNLANHYAQLVEPKLP